ncbi:MAG: hypothetical protein AB2687_00670 [Candidatus Thiodiazotropha taylori]
MNTFRVKFVVIALLSIILYSCGGGSGGDDNNNQTTTPDTDLNNISGRIFVNDRNNGVMVDISSGTVSKIPNVNWDQTGDYSPRATFTAVPNKEGSLFVLTIDNCDYLSSENSGYRYRDCIVILDASGNVIRSQQFYEGLWEGAKASFNGSYIAYMYMDEPNESNPNAELHIVDSAFQYLSGTEINHSVSFNSGLLWRDFDWVNTGQIIYGYDNSLFLTDAYETVGRLIYTIPTATTNSDHFISKPKISPDGKKIAFRYMLDSNHLIKQGNVWVMNIDGADPHRLVYTPDYKAADGSTISAYQVYNDFDWSPDGRHIVVLEGGTSGDLVSGPDGAGDTLYIIPSDSRDVPLNNDGEHGIIHLRTYYHNSTELSYRFEPYSGTITWVH